MLDYFPGTCLSILGRQEALLLALGTRMSGAGDPPVELLHKWRTGAKAGGVKYGRASRTEELKRCHP